MIQKSKWLCWGPAVDRVMGVLLSGPRQAPDRVLPAILCFSESTASVPPHSDVYRMLHDNQDEPTRPRQSGSFRVLQELVNDGPGEQSPASLTEAAGGWREERTAHSGRERLKPRSLCTKDLGSAMFRKGRVRVATS